MAATLRSPTDLFAKKIQVLIFLYKGMSRAYHIVLQQWYFCWDYLVTMAVHYDTVPQKVYHILIKYNLN